MFNAIAAFLKSTWEIAGQFPAEYSGIGAQEPESSLAIIIRPAPSCAHMGAIPVPRDVIRLILRHLSPDELFKVCRVCRLFNEVASSNPLWNSYDLRELFPNATFIDREVWQTHIDVEKYGIELEQRGRPCVDKTDYVELKRMESQVEDGMGITIITLFKGDKLSNVQESAANPKAGNPITFQYFSPDLLALLGDAEAEAVTVAMTNNVFIDSRYKTVAERKQIVEDLKCKAPGILAATRLGVMRFNMSSPGAPVRLFGDSPWTYTLCLDEKKDESTGEVVEVISHFGGFALPGPDAYSRDFSGFDSESRGVGGQRKFKEVLGP